MTEYCNPVDRAKNPQLDTICACKDGVAAMIDGVNTWKISNASFEAENIAYQKALYDWNIKLDTWNRQKTDQKNYLINEKKKLNSCLNGNNDASGFCSQDHGAGWTFSYWENDNCGLYRRGICQRNTDKVNADLLVWERNNPIPIKPTFSNERPVFKTEPIQCCSQIFSDISTTTGALNFNNIVQTCNQEINTKIKNLIVTPTPTKSSITSTPITSTPITSTPITSTPITSTPDNSKESNIIIKYGIIFAILFIIFLFFLLLLV